MYLETDNKSKVLLATILSLISVLCIAEKGVHSYVSVNTDQTNDRLILEQYKNKDLCSNIEKFLEKKMFSGNGNINSLVDWEKSHYEWEYKGKVKKHSKTYVDFHYTSEKVLGEKRALVRRKSFLGGYEFHIMMLLPISDFNDKTLSLNGNDITRKFDQLNSLGGDYKYWLNEKIMSTSWIEYFEFNKKGYFLFFPTDTNVYYKDIYLVADISPEDVDDSVVKVNGIIHQCLFIGKNFSEAR